MLDLNMIDFRKVILREREREREGERKESERERASAKSIFVMLCKQ